MAGFGLGLGLRLEIGLVLSGKQVVHSLTESALAG